MLATIQKLEEELENYKKRVNFLKQYIKHLTEHTVNSKGDLIYKSFWMMLIRLIDYKMN